MQKEVCIAVYCIMEMKSPLCIYFFTILTRIVFFSFATFLGMEIGSTYSRGMDGTTSDACECLWRPNLQEQ